MTDHRTVFNHVGLCVADRKRSRRFYEGLLGFQFWWELELPDEGTAALLQLAGRSEFALPIWSATALFWSSSTIRNAMSMPGRSVSWTK